MFSLEWDASMSERQRVVIWVDPHDMGWVWKSYEIGMIKKFLVPEDPTLDEGDPREFAKEVKRLHNGNREPRYRPHVEPGEMKSINRILQHMQTDPEKIWNTGDLEQMMPEWGYSSSSASACLTDLRKYGLVEALGASCYKLTEDGATTPPNKDLPRNPIG